jgi:hypothetical protein
VVTTTRPERLTEKGMPVEMVIDLDVDPAQIGEIFKGMKHEGHLYPQKVNDWFSAAIDRKICLVHSSNQRFKNLDP